MSRPVQHASGLAATIMLILSLGACGSSSHGIPAGSVALIEHTPLTTGTLNHWMNSIVGGDFFERWGKRAPLGLVSEPANYPTCVRAASVLTRASGRRPPFSSSQIGEKCRLLHQAIKEQTMAFLISVQWRIDEAAEQGITISDAQLAASSREDAAKRYPKGGEYEEFLADHEWAASDVSYQLKRNMLTTKLREHITHTAAGTEESPQIRARFVKFILSNTKKRTASTLCRPAYRVSTCRGYKPPKSTIPSPILILEELTEP
jgi:hypothetical protein